MYDLDGFAKIGKIAYRNVDMHNLFIFPELPSWVVLSDEQSIVFKYLTENANLEYVRTKVYDFLQYNVNIENIISELSILLHNRKILPWPSVAYNAPDPDKYPTHIHLCLTHRCNLRCKHCFLSAGEKIRNELSLSQWIEGLNNILNIIKNPFITVSGGEPTTYKNIKELLKFLYENGCHITLYSNGCNTLKDLLSYVESIQISLEGISEFSHDFIRGEGVYRKVLHTIKDIPRDKLNIALLIMKHNFKEIESGLKDFINNYDIDINNLRINAEIERKGRATSLDNETHQFLYKNANEIFKFISSTLNLKPRLLLRNMRNCGIGISIGIDSDGKIYPCDNFYKSVSDVFSKNLKEELQKAREINIKTEICNIPFCKDCDIRYICLGGCKINNILSTGSYTKPICTESDKRIKYLRMVYDCGV